MEKFTEKLIEYVREEIKKQQSNVSHIELGEIVSISENEASVHLRTGSSIKCIYDVERGYVVGDNVSVLVAGDPTKMENNAILGKISGKKRLFVGQNLLENGVMENNVTPWTSGENLATFEINNEEFYMGSSSLKVIPLNPYLEASFNQVLPSGLCKPNEVYKSELFVKASGEAEFYVGTKIDWYNASNNPLRKEEEKEFCVLNENSNWIYITKDYLSPQNVSYADFQIFVKKGEGEGSLFIDNVGFYGLTAKNVTSTEGANIIIQDEGIDLPQRSKLNFVGDGIVAQDNQTNNRTDVILDNTLNQISQLGSTADKMIYTSEADTWAETPITSVGRSILDDASVAEVRQTLDVPGLNVSNVFGSYDQTFDNGTFKIDSVNHKVKAKRFKSEEADGATAIGFEFDTDNQLTTSGSKLISVKNKGTEKFAVDKDGIILLSSIPTNLTGKNADQTDGFDATQTPTANKIVVADANGHIDGWINIAPNSDKTDGFHASQTPTANTIPVADSNGYITNWVKGRLIYWDYKQLGGTYNWSTTSTSWVTIQNGDSPPVYLRFDNVFTPPVDAYALVFLYVCATQSAAGNYIDLAIGNNYPSLTWLNELTLLDAPSTGRMTLWAIHYFELTAGTGYQFCGGIKVNAGTATVARYHTRLFMVVWSKP